MISSANCPPPGIYHDVDFATYLSWDAISNSRLQAALKSMAHFHDQQPVEETPSMRLGTLCHAGKFEPLQVARRYVVMPAFEKDIRKSDGSHYDKPKATAAYREMVTEFNLANTDKIVVTQSEYEAMLGMVSALSRNERAQRYLSVDGDTCVEVAIVWIDSETGVKCKGRVDCLKQKSRIVGDLKTSRDVDRFDNVIFNYSYHRQGAFYIDGLKALTGHDFIYTITAVENFAPYGVKSAPLSDDAIELGRDEYKRLLIQIAESRRVNAWTGYASPDEWNVPSWARRSNQSESVELVIGGKKVSV